MICAQCGNNVAEGAAACPRCGAPVAGAASHDAGQVPAGAGGPGAPMAAAPAQPFAFDAGRLSQTDRITGIASLVLLISLFLPWFSVSAGPYSASASGTAAHGYLWIVFLLVLAIEAYLVLQAGFAQLPFQLPLSGEQLLLGATGINLLLVLIAFVFKPGGYSLGVGWSFGAFIALIAAIVAFAPLITPIVRARSNRH